MKMITKTISRKNIPDESSLFLKIFNISPVNRAVLEDAANAGFPVFEDAVFWPYYEL